MSTYSCIFDFENFATLPQPYSRVALIPLNKFGTDGNLIITGEPIIFHTDQNDTYTVANLLLGNSYEIHRDFLPCGLFISASATGTYYASNILFAQVSQSNGQLAYTTAQSDARYIQSGSLVSTASFAISASYSPASPVVSCSFASQSLSSSFAATASYVINDNDVSASWASASLTSSYVTDNQGNVLIMGSGSTLNGFPLLGPEFFLSGSQGDYIVGSVATGIAIHSLLGTNIQIHSGVSVNGKGMPVTLNDNSGSFLSLASTPFGPSIILSDPNNDTFTMGSGSLVMTANNTASLTVTSTAITASVPIIGTASFSNTASFALNANVATTSSNGFMSAANVGVLSSRAGRNEGSALTFTNPNNIMSGSFSGLFTGAVTASAINMSGSLSVSGSTTLLGAFSASQDISALAGNAGSTVPFANYYKITNGAGNDHSVFNVNCTSPDHPLFKIGLAKGSGPFDAGNITWNRQASHPNMSLSCDGTPNGLFVDLNGHAGFQSGIVAFAGDTNLSIDSVNRALKNSSGVTTLGWNTSVLTCTASMAVTNQSGSVIPITQASSSVFLNGVTSSPVLFKIAMPNTAYAVSISPSGSAAGGIFPTWTGKTVTGFTASFTNALTGAFDWVATSFTQ